MSDRPIRVGVQLQPQQGTLAKMRETWLRVEEMGADTVFNWDHFHPLYGDPDGPHFESWTVQAAMAESTSRIQIGCLVTCNSYRNANLQADMARTVDHISGGRFIFGIGVGWDEAEFKDLGLPFAERGAMADEYLAIIKAAWSADEPSYAGRYLTFGGATFSPRPAQKPHPPVWAGGAPGALSAPAMRRAATLCDGWHPLGLGWADLEKGMATVKELAKSAGRPAGAVLFCPRNGLALGAKAGPERAPYEGAPDQVAADVKRAAGLGCEWITFDMPKADVPGMLAVIERFAKEVKPGTA